MKAYAKRIVLNPLFSGSAIMIFGSNLGNFFAYVYHFAMGRILSPLEYGEVGAILSLLGLLSVLISFMGLVIVKFVSSAADKDLGGVFSWFYTLGTKIGLVAGALIMLASPLISEFLHIDILIIFLVGPIFLISTLTFVLKAFLQGLMRFAVLVVSSNIQIIFRLVIGSLLVILGFSVFGAVAGYLLAGVVDLFFVRWVLRKFRVQQVKNVFTKNKEVINYAIPIFISTFFSYALISLDVIVVKHYFPGEEAGVYTVLSTLSRIVFYAVAPVSGVMFPIIAKRRSLGQAYKPIFRLSLLLSLFVVAGILVIYKLLPSLVVGILYGPGRYLEAYQLLPVAGLFVAFFALSSLIVNYYLSLNRTKIVILFPLALVAQVVGFVLFHETLLSIILVSVVATGALFLTLMGRLVYEREV